MIKNLPRNWLCHGLFAQTDLLAGVLPRSGIHYVAGSDGEHRDAVLADLATAIASDAVTCGLSAPDDGGSRTSLSGFFGLPTGAASGVAAITGKGRAEALSRAVAANAAARGISRPLPIAVMAGYSAEASGFRLHELEQHFRAEHGVGIGLLIVDLALPQGELLALQRPGRAILAVGESAPVALAQGSVVLAVSGGRMTLARPLDGKRWARSFELTTVDGVPVLAPGGEAPVAAIWQAAKPIAAPEPVAKEPQPELPIVSRVALIISRGELAPEVRAKWADAGFTVVQSQDAALPRPGEIVGGKREIVIAAANDDQRIEELRGRVNRLGERAAELGVADVVMIRIAA
ncbi:MAG: hypothetical protein EKK29_05970 [Hyphomicrobiales bacterium]|nr:MAG: hypothetical protein EKK29_05970 [Hyphomicrobiales bacterium]